jgi:hypothetical protein
MNRNARRVFDGRRVSHLMRFDTPWRGAATKQPLLVLTAIGAPVAAGGNSAGHARQRDGARAVEFSMTDYFQRQLAYYADAHRDQVNSVMRIIGNPLLLVAMVWNAPLEADRIRRQF